MYIQGIRYGYVESLHHKDILWRGQYCCPGLFVPALCDLPFPGSVDDFQRPNPDSASNCHRIGLKKKHVRLHKLHYLRIVPSIVTAKSKSL